MPEPRPGSVPPRPTTTTARPGPLSPHDARRPDQGAFGIVVAFAAKRAQVAAAGAVSGSC